MEDQDESPEAFYLRKGNVFLFEEGEMSGPRLV